MVESKHTLIGCLCNPILKIKDTTYISAYQLIIYTLKHVVRPSVRPSVRSSGRITFEPSAGARKKPTVGGLNFLVYFWYIYMAKAPPLTGQSPTFFFFFFIAPLSP